jgi:hypothetical protein
LTENKTTRAAARSPSLLNATGSQMCTGSRRQFLWETGAGFTGLAMLSLLERDGFFAAKDTHAAERGRNASRRDLGGNPLAELPPHFAPKAKRCIFLFMYGGPPQMDTFDYKPELQKRDGQLSEVELRDQVFAQKKLLGSRREFRRHGESGQWCSDVFPSIARHMDELAVVKSLYADSFIHGLAILQMNSGVARHGHPALGSWLTYGLGTTNENLPGFVVMTDPRGGNVIGSQSWSSAYMPAAYQGTVFRAQGEPILNLNQPPDVPSSVQRNRIQAINELNRRHLKGRAGYSELDARIASYELAFRLQSAAPEALDLSQETRKTKDLYGLYDPRPKHPLSLGPRPFGQQCLVARRLVERGVRFVQLYHGGGIQQQSWDSHQGVEENLRIHGPEVDRPIAGLLSDLKQRGLLDDTLVIWGGEFGRQPVSQNGGVGRDHNPKGFTYWLAGAGVRGGTSYGETDELGFAAAQDPRHVRDLHATILHLMGFDHHRLSYFYGGLDQRLTGVDEATPIYEILA